MGDVAAALSELADHSVDGESSEADAETSHSSPLDCRQPSRTAPESNARLAQDPEPEEEPSIRGTHLQGEEVGAPERGGHRDSETHGHGAAEAQQSPSRAARRSLQRSRREC